METSFTRLVGCRVPLQQAGMGATSSVDLAAAVADAGGLGMLGTAGMHRESVMPALESLGERTSGVFGVNFLVPFLERDIVASTASRAKVVEFFYGEPTADLVDLGHDAGALVSWQVGSVAEAVKAAECGCDFVIAQGIEAGGHIRGELELFALLSSVLDAVDVPVLAAGGIGTASKVAAALAAGAAGVRIGTRFLGAREADVHPIYRDALFAASAEDTELTSAFSTWWDAPHRVLRACISAATADDAESVGETPWGDGRMPIPRFCVLHPVAATTGHVEAMAQYAGQSVSDVRELQSAVEIVAELMTGVDAAD